MRNIRILLKYQFLTFLGNLTSKKNARKTLSGGFLVLLISCIMTVSFTSTAVMTCSQFVELGKIIPKAEELAMFSNLIIGLLLVVLFTVMRSVYPAKTKDEEMLLGLPVKKRDIIIAKSVYNYLFDVLSYAMVLLPSFIVYYVMVDHSSFMIIIWGVVFILLISLLSSSISYLISLMVAKYLTRFKFFSIIQSLITLLFLGGYLVLQYSLPSILENVTGDVNDYLNSIVIIKYLISWILYNDLVVFGIVLAIFLGIGILALILRINHFGEQFKGYVNNKKDLVYKKRKLITSLYHKELKYYLSTSIYFINTIIGCFFVIGISVAYRIIGEEQIFAFIEALPEFLQIDTRIWIVILSCVVISMTCTTSVSISLEGNSFWILQVHPVKIKDVFDAKILVNVTICTAACFISSLLFMDYHNPLTFIPYFVIPALTSLNTGVLGLIINLIFPKLNFDSVEAVCKRSMTVPLAMFGCLVMALMPAVVVLAFGKSWSLLMYSIISLGVLIFIFGILYGFLLTKGKKMFKKMI